MGISDEMPKKEVREKILYTRLETAQHAAIKSLIAQAGGTQDQFVFDAVMEKLERKKIETTDVGVLRGLSPDDRARVGWLADLLREQPNSPKLREVVDAQRGVLQIVAV